VARDLVKNYSTSKGDHIAVNHVSFSINPMECVGLIGQNGAGKSTIAKMLTGQTQITHGSVSKKAKILNFNLGNGLRDELSGRDNIIYKCLLLGCTKREISAMCDDIIHFAELEDVIDDPLRTFSSGMRARLGFSIMVHQTFDILIIDEGLSVGDNKFIQKAFKKIESLKAQGKGILFISHSAAAMKKWCDSVIWLEEGYVREAGTPDMIVSDYESSEAKIYSKMFIPMERVETERETLFSKVKKYLKEQRESMLVAFRISRYSTKANYFNHKLSRVWEWLDPLVQLVVYYIIFSVLFHKVVPDFPAMPWMIFGLAGYTFVNQMCTTGANMIPRMYRSVVQFRFHISALPLSAFFGFLPQVLVSIVFGAFLSIWSGYALNLYALQVFYYLVALSIFGVSISLFTATILIVFPDYRFFVNYSFRFLLHASGIIFSFDQFAVLPRWFVYLLTLNPLYFLARGFRDSFFSTNWFWQHGIDNLIFWGITLIILLIAISRYYHLQNRIGDLI
jgi:teichoic acid transport system permease protein